MSNFYGLLGEKLGHSYSPKIHHLILEKLNLEGSYNLFEVEKENLYKSVQGLKLLGAKGINVTIPYKIQIMQYLDNISEEAKKIGSINTISFKKGILTGYNTDYHGFGASLKQAHVDISNKKAVVLGSGGASKAVVQYAMDNGMNEIIYVSREINEAKSINDFKVISYNDIDNLKNQDILINCTPCGMYPNIEHSPVKKSVLSKFTVVVDLIYNPEETLLLKQSKNLGLKTVNGLYMLVAQAAAAQEIWQDVTINKELVEDIYNKIKLSN